jgi:hypothetical protein
MKEYKLNVFGKTITLRYSDEACSFIETMQELDKKCQLKVKYLLIGPMFVSFADYDYNVRSLGDAMVTQTFGPTIGDDMKATREKVMRHATVDEELSRPDFEIPYLYIVFDDETCEKWHEELTRIINEAEKIKAAILSEEETAAKKEQEDRRRWNQVKVYSRYVPPYDSGEDGRVDSLFTNGTCSIRMIQAFVFDGGKSSFPQRFEGTYVKREEYTEEEKDLIDWLEKYGVFAGRSIME